MAVDPSPPSQARDSPGSGRDSHFLSLADASEVPGNSAFGGPRSAEVLGPWKRIKYQEFKVQRGAY